MSSLYVNVRQSTRGNVTTPMVLWAIVMAVVLFYWEVSNSSTHHADAWLTGGVVTTLLGLYLGWKRRSAAAFVAPLVSWLFAWFPVLVAAMIRRGVVVGFFDGVITVTIGWIGIGFVEFAWLSIVAFLVRLVRGGPDRKEPEVLIISPDK